MPPKGERRKQQIIDAAKEMFIEKGFQSTHIGQVCEKLNIARGTVYQYFSNKKEILFALLDSVIERIDDTIDYDDLKDFLNTNPEKDKLLEFVNKRISSSVEVFLHEPIIIKLIFKDISGIDEHIIERVDNSLLKIKRIISRDIEEAINRGIYRESVNSKITASMLLGGIMMIIYELDKKDQNLLEESLIQDIVNNHLLGILRSN